MSTQQPEPGQNPQQPDPYGPPPSGQYAQQPGQFQPGPTPAKRPWYKMKRFAIPLGTVAVLTVIGLVAPDAPGEGSDAAPLVSVSDQPSESPETAAGEPAPSAEPTGASAEELAAQEEAERVAAEQAAAEEAARVEAERVADEEAAAAEAAAEGTPAQQNAFRAAENYLDFAAFSRSGLIKQLEFEQYSTEDGNWAVDRVTVDWNEQAAKSAQNYLDMMAFSRSGLVVDQLIFEGFTPGEAEYGVSQTGL